MAGGEREVIGDTCIVGFGCGLRRTGTVGSSRHEGPGFRCDQGFPWFNQAATRPAPAASTDRMPAASGYRPGPYRAETSTIASDSGIIAGIPPIGDAGALAGPHHPAAGPAPVTPM